MTLKFVVPQFLIVLQINNNGTKDLTVCSLVSFKKVRFGIRFAKVVSYKPSKDTYHVVHHFSFCACTSKISAYENTPLKLRFHWLISR